MNKTILAVNLDNGRLKEISAIASSCGIDVRTVPESKYRSSLGFLSHIPGIPALAKEDIACDIDDEMIVFCGVDDKTLDDYLESSKETGFKQVKLKAVITSVNITWSLRYLYNELKKEALD